MATNDCWAELRETEIPLYEGVAPGSEGWGQVETDGTIHGGLHVVRNVVRPTLTPFLPAERRPFGSAVPSVAVIIAPGGAWHFLAWDHEGIQVARWLQARGIAAFILKYRLMPTDDTFPADYEARMDSGDIREWLVPFMPLLAADALQAIRLVRSRAGEWGIDPGKVGIMGFSAGGTVTSLATLRYDAETRPDFGAPIYGAGAPGPVPADAPPIFIVCAVDDDLVTYSQEMYHLWHAAGREVEMHLYARGGHGFGMNPTGLPAQGWIERFHEWLAMLGC
jgi:acetyl esterase/lipase